MPTTDAKAIDIITRALKLVGVLGAAEMPSAEDATDALDVLNGMIDAWTMDSLYVYSVGYAVYPLVASQQDYTIGESGTPDFSAVRPSKLINANIVITTNNPETRLPIYIMDDDDWMNIRVRRIGPTIPTAIYYSRDYPNGTLHLYPVPDSGYSLELETWQTLSQFADLTTAFSFPPGYYEAMYQNLGLRFCTPEYGINDVPSSIQALALASRARIESLNLDPAPQQNCDAGVQGSNSLPLFWIKNVAPFWYR